MYALCCDWMVMCVGGRISTHGLAKVELRAARRGGCGKVECCGGGGVLEEEEIVTENGKMWDGGGLGCAPAGERGGGRYK